MQLSHKNTVIYREGNVELSIVTESESPLFGGRARTAVDTYYLEIDGETRRMDASTYACLKRVMKAIMGIEE